MLCGGAVVVATTSFEPLLGRALKRLSSGLTVLLSRPIELLNARVSGSDGLAVVFGMAFVGP